MIDATYTGHNLVFLVGCPRSGTTWLQRLLACHPAVRTGQESHVFEVHIAPQLREWRKLADQSNRGGVGMACYFTEEEFLRLLKGYVVALLQPMVGSLTDGQLFLEKTPSHAACIPEIIELLPQSRIIHMLRDPRDVLVSLKAASQSWGKGWAPQSAAEALDLWATYVRAARQKGQSLPPQQYLELKYEDLHADPTRVLRQCAAFLSVDWPDSALEAAIAANAPSVARASGGGTPIPLNGEAKKRNGPAVREPDGFIGGATVGSWKNHLSLSDKYWVWRSKIRKVMVEYGYQ